MIKFDSSTVNIWFTADTHYWHKNICRGVSMWNDKEQSTRDFSDEETMSKYIVKQINTYVKENDILFHLGDWSFGGVDNIWNFRKQLNCLNIHLILGNHDHHIKNNKELENCPYKKCDESLIRAKEIFSSVQQYLEIEINGRMLCLMHYPIEEWNNRYKDSYCLHGHSHGRCREIPKRLDVGLDNYYKLFKDYKPFSFNEIEKLLKF